MKKMLIRLFLFLVLTCSLSYNIAGGENIKMMEYYKTKLEQIDRNYKLLQTLSANLEKELTDIAYSDLDSIPIQSPISVTELQRISGDYGMRKHPIYKDRRFHYGIDFVAPVNTKIRSTADGIVTKITKSTHGYGNQIVIKHGYRYETRYAHLSDIQVIEGQKVEVGDIIGTLGSSGLTTGPHLHYEIFNNNKQIDPMFFSYNNEVQRTNEQYISTLTALETT